MRSIGASLGLTALIGPTTSLASYKLIHSYDIPIVILLYTATNFFWFLSIMIYRARQ